MRLEILNGGNMMRQLLKVLGITMALTQPGIPSAREVLLTLDNCSPKDTSWNNFGGCALKQGDVTTAEFGSLLPFGHPSWRFEPQYIVVKKGEKIVVKNRGGDAHTFTEVAAFGGGFIGQLNNPENSAAVPECDGGPNNPAVSASFIKPGSKVVFKELTKGLKLYQCCLHPWMRSVIRVN
jgi:hypothetical protein